MTHACNARLAYGRSALGRVLVGPIARLFEPPSTDEELVHLSHSEQRAEVLTAAYVITELSLEIAGDSLGWRGGEELPRGLLECGEAKKGAMHPALLERLKESPLESGRLLGERHVQQAASALLYIVGGHLEEEGVERGGEGGTCVGQSRLVRSRNRGDLRLDALQQRRQGWSYGHASITEVGITGPGPQWAKTIEI